MGLNLKEVKKNFSKKAYEQIKNKIDINNKKSNLKKHVLTKKENERKYENKLYEIVLKVFCEQKVFREFIFIPGRKFKADVAIPELKLAFELDGYRHHGLSKYGFKRDREKDRLAHLNGYRIIRFFATELKEGNIENVEAYLIELSYIYQSIREPSKTVK